MQIILKYNVYTFCFNCFGNLFVRQSLIDYCNNNRQSKCIGFTYVINYMNKFKNINRVTKDNKCKTIINNIVE